LVIDFHDFILWLEFIFNILQFLCHLLITDNHDLMKK